MIKIFIEADHRTRGKSTLARLVRGYIKDHFDTVKQVQLLDDLTLAEYKLAQTELGPARFHTDEDTVYIYVKENV